MITPVHLCARYSMTNNMDKTGDSLKVEQNEDGTFFIEWDKDDPKWKHLNGLTSKEIVSMIEEVVKADKLDDF